MNTSQINFATRETATQGGFKSRPYVQWLKREYHGLTVFLLLFMTVIFVGDHINHKFHQTDFGAYLQAAYRLLGAEEIYDREPGPVSKMPFKYAPAVAALFTPFTLVEVPTAKVAYYIINCGVVFLLIWLSRKLIYDLTRGEVRAGQLAAFFAFLALGEFLYREIDIGNVNALVSVMAIAACICAHRAKDGQAGFWLGLATLFKPHYAILLLFYLVLRKWKMLLAFTGVWVAGVAVTLLLYRVDGTVALYRHWLNVMLVHNAAGTWIHPMYGMNTMVEVFSQPFNLLGWWGVIESPLFPVVVLGLAIVGLIYLAWRAKRETLPADFAILYLIAFTPLLMQVDVNHFVFLYPVALYLLAIRKLQPLWWTIALIAALILLGGNMYEIVGRKTHVLLNDVGVYGMGGVLLMALLLLARRPVGKLIPQTARV